MKQCLRTVLCFACLAILITAFAFENDQMEEEPGLWEKNFITSPVYLKTMTDRHYNDSFEKPRVSLCCHVDTFFIKNDCVEIPINETEMVQLPAVYDTNFVLENITTSDKYFDFVIWNPCAGRAHPLDPLTYEDETWYLMSNGSILLPNLKKPILDYHQYCLARVNSTEYREYLVFSCMENNDDGEGGTIFASGIFVSVPFLIATYIVYWLLPELRNLHGLTLRGYVGCLATAYSILGILQQTSAVLHRTGICITLAFICYFSFLASFFWLNVMCFDIWWTFGGFRSLQGNVKERERKKFIIYSIYAWGSASIFTIICVIMEFVPSVPKYFIRPEFIDSCWLSTKLAKALYFYAPMGITVVCNIYLFISIALKIMRHKKDTAHHLTGSENRRHNDNKQWFKLYLKLFIVMGISWSMEIVSFLFDDAPQYIWYLPDLTNALQGLIIFIIFVWKKKIKRLLLKRFGCQKFFSRNLTRSDYQSSLSASYISTTTSGMMSLQEKINPSMHANSRAKSSSNETDI